MTSHALAANVFEKMLMPGPLASDHAKFENDCEACHKAFAKGAQDNLCLVCHKETAADRKAKRGFHGKAALVLNQSCSSCHNDHEGRDADIVRLDWLTFDHRQTEFELQAKHKDVPCGSCHEQGKKFRTAPSDCLSCHRDSEPHKGALGKACQDCHSVKAWGDLKPFDHGRTKFKLAGAHEKLACMSCHVGEVYKDLPSLCWDCHKLQDVHDNRLGQKCNDCHSQVAWKPAKFDHDRTEFKLRGIHAKAQCGDCHKPSLPMKLATSCKSCHADDDVHKAQLGERCDDCHGVEGWRKQVNFDHELTDFPIVGLHSAVPCEACHASPAYADAPTGCYSCHKGDDVHQGRLTADCAECHSAVGWSRWDFDHGRRTRFALTGKHAKTGCYGCHSAKYVKTAKLPADCYSCHRKEDVHKGQFGTNCARCHTTTTFAVALIPK